MLGISIIVSLVVFTVYNDDETSQPSNRELIPVRDAVLELYKQVEEGRIEKAEVAEKLDHILDDLPPEYRHLNRRYQIAMSQLPDIELYGRAIDQNGAPAANVKIAYDATSDFLAQGGGRGAVTTDSEGYFIIESHGAMLHLTGILDEKYSGRFYSDSSNTEARNLPPTYPDWKAHNTKDKPYLIHVWRKQGYEGAKRGKISMLHDIDGSDYTYSLTKSQRDKTRISKGRSDDGQLYISCTRESVEQYRDYRDWRVSIEVNNGGIQETEDYFLNAAPLTGYSSSIVVDMKQGQSDYKHVLREKRYYIVSGDVYASLLIAMEPYATGGDNTCAISIQYKYNSDKSRNLEMDKYTRYQEKQSGRTTLAAR